MSANKAITILSGGLDSMVSTAMARSKHKVVLALTFDYGQRAARREIQAAGKLCKLWKIKHKIIKLPWLAQITNTALVNKHKPLPRFSTQALKDSSTQRLSARAVWVPNRNGVFINIAAAFAEMFDANFIIAGFNKEEAATFPDNSKEFVASMNKTLKLGTLKWQSHETFAQGTSMERLSHETLAARQACNGEAMKHLPIGKYATLQVVSYTQDMTKRDIAQYATKNALPIALCWPCYEGGKKLCEKCESCVRFFRALKEGTYKRL